jgi:hypothetical protein
MNRRERRIWKRKTRRIGVALASVAMLAATAGLGGAAFGANGSGGGGSGGGGGNGGFGGGGLVYQEPGTGSGVNGSIGTETIWCNGHLGLENGPPAHDAYTCL